MKNKNKWENTTNSGLLPQSFDDIFTNNECNFKDNPLANQKDSSKNKPNKRFGAINDILQSEAEADTDIDIDTQNIEVEQSEPNMISLTDLTNQNQFEMPNLNRFDSNGNKLEESLSENINEVNNNSNNMPNLCSISKIKKDKDYSEFQEYLPPSLFNKLVNELNEKKNENQENVKNMNYKRKLSFNESTVSNSSDNKKNRRMEWSKDGARIQIDDNIRMQDKISSNKYNSNDNSKNTNAVKELSNDDMALPKTENLLKKYPKMKMMDRIGLIKQVLERYLKEK